MKILVGLPPYKKEKKKNNKKNLPIEAVASYTGYDCQAVLMLLGTVVKSVTECVVPDIIGAFVVTWRKGDCPDVPWLLHCPVLLCQGDVLTKFVDRLCPR